MVSHGMYRYRGDVLRGDVDVQLHSAFSDGNWPTVIRLADKRAKALMDPYYEAIKICAEAKQDHAAKSQAVAHAVEVFLKSHLKNKTIPDLSTIELYEWALEEDRLNPYGYSKTIGPLRLSWAKANPESPHAVKCIQACLFHWDIANAQQIAVALDKALAKSGDRRYFFWNVTLTFLQSRSRHCPPGMEAVLRSLALRHLEKAAATVGDTEPNARDLRTEEEFGLYYRILVETNSSDKFLEHIQSDRDGALRHFREGRKSLFFRTLDVIQQRGDWQLAFDLCHQALGVVGEHDSTLLLTADWRVWRRFIEAAGKLDDDRSLSRVQDTLKKFSTCAGGSVAEMYRRNHQLAALEAAFSRSEPGSSLEEDHPSARVAALSLYLEESLNNPSVFDDVKPYVVNLTFDEARTLVEDVLHKSSDEKGDQNHSMMRRVLGLKLKYLLTTCRHTEISPSRVQGDKVGIEEMCKVCSGVGSWPCQTCLQNVVIEGCAAHAQLGSDEDYQDLKFGNNPKIDLSVVVGMALLKLSGLRQRADFTRSPLHGVDLSLFLQGVLVLDRQLRRTPQETPLRLLVVKLWLMLGCASRAYEKWVPMDVKRTIQDALSPHFFDRISSLSPNLFQQSTRPLTEPLRKYYEKSLRDYPQAVWQAFQAGSYQSILDMVEFDTKLRTSCTLVMAVLEERRATRSLGGKIEQEIGEIRFIEDIDEYDELAISTDYGSFPDFESAHAGPFHELLRIGPELSNARAHLGLLSEKFVDGITLRMPKDFRPQKPSEAEDKYRSYVSDFFVRLEQAMARFLYHGTAPDGLTGPERRYHEVVYLLCRSVWLCSKSSRTQPAPLVSDNVRSIKLALSVLKNVALEKHATTSPESDIFFSITDMHSFSYFRETALIIKYTANYVAAFHEKDFPRRDENGKVVGGLHEGVIAEFKALDVLATKCLVDMRIRIKGLKEKLAEGGWMDRILEWTFGDQTDEDSDVGKAVAAMVGGTSEAEEWIGHILEDWRDSIKGWTTVRFE